LSPELVAALDVREAQAREGATRKSLLATVEQAMSLFPKAQRKVSPAIA